MLSVFVLLNGSDFDRAISASADALGGLDCEFEDCSKPEPNVIVKEKLPYSKSGYYDIFIDNNKYNIYCEMKLSGGG